MKTMMKPLLLILAGALVAGCGADGQTVTNRGGSQNPPPANNGGGGIERASYPAGLGCGWQFVSDINTTNVAFPDESAQYWVALIPQIPGTRLRIDGRYPSVRYFSYNVYDPLLRPVDAVADSELVANTTGGYTAYVEFTGKPKMPASNTIYAGETSLGPQQIPNPALTGIIYRVYVPDEGFDFDGGVGLPVLTLETADGEVELLPYADCEQPLLPNLGGGLPDPGLNDLLLTIDFPEELGVIRFPTAAYPPTTRVFYGLGPTAVAILGNALPAPLPPEFEQNVPLGDGGGFLSNIHNAYTSTTFSRDGGRIFVLRGKAPTYQGDGRAAGGVEDLRFWSICQNEFVTQRYVACVADHQALLDEDGYYTVVVSDVADRPESAVAENHINWIPWGPFPDGLLIYRHMLPSPHFAEAIQNVPKGTPPQEIMGEYLAVGAYCTPETFAGAGQQPADIFAACLEETLASDKAGQYLGVVPVP